MVVGPSNRDTRFDCVDELHQYEEVPLTCTSLVIVEAATIHDGARKPGAYSCRSLDTLTPHGKIKHRLCYSRVDMTKEQLLIPSRPDVQIDDL